MVRKGRSCTTLWLSHRDVVWRRLVGMEAVNLPKEYLVADRAFVLALRSPREDQVAVEFYAVNVIVVDFSREEMRKEDCLGFVVRLFDTCCSER